MGLVARSASAQPGGGAAPATLRGTVWDARTGEVLIGATVRLPVSQQGTATLLDGTFQLRGLVPGGAVTVQALSLGYAPQTLTVTLQAGTTQSIGFRLAATGRALAEVIVAGKLDRESEASGRRSEQKADNLLNIVSARAIELSPDVTVGNVLQRVSGVSVVRNGSGDGQYAIIRGMDRRYNYTLVNGVKIPSPDPKNRYVPLDIFPAELLERLEVVKALTPNMEGDAIGGAMNLVMKSAPDRLVVVATAAGGYSDLLARRPFAGFSTVGIPAKDPAEQRGAAYRPTPADFSQSRLTYSSLRVPVNSLFGLTFGNRFLGGRLGVLASGSRQSTYRGTTTLYYQPNGQPSPDPAPNTFAFDQLQRRQTSTLQSRGGAQARLDYRLNENNQLSFYALALQLDEAQHRRIEADNVGQAGDVPIRDRSRFQQLRLSSGTLQGEHQLRPGLRLTWTGTYALGTTALPDLTDGEVVNATGANTPKGVFVGSIQHTWAHSRDQDWTGLANLAYRPAEWLELTGGGLLRDKQRSSYFNFYQLDALDASGGFGTGTANRQPFTGYEQARVAFDKPGADQAKTTDGNNYTANERITAGYIQAKLTRGPLSVLGGLRAESTYQEYYSQLPVTAPGKTGVFRYLDLLPSVHIKYQLSNQQNLRLSYFKGISRPSLAELIPAPFSTNEFYTEAGNPYLKHTQADNVDLRYERFGTANAQLLVGAFYKRIVNPIEFGFAQQTIGLYYYQPQNFGTGTNFGAELVFAKYVGRWGLSGNYTYTHSAITTPKRVYYRDPSGNLTYADAGQKTAEYPSAPTQPRPLQGQSDHVANLAGLYKNADLGLDVQLAGVYTGRRINIVSAYRNLDQWQRATLQLDFSAEQRLPNHLTVFAKMTNLLNTPTILEIPTTNNLAGQNLPSQDRADRVFIQRDDFGRTYLLGLRYRL